MTRLPAVVTSCRALHFLVAVRGAVVLSSAALKGRLCPCFLITLPGFCFIMKHSKMSICRGAADEIIKHPEALAHYKKIGSRHKNLFFYFNYTPLSEPSLADTSGVSEQYRLQEPPQCLRQKDLR
ncbi:unnamed protein product [Pleuronectes platessa]|uniref:Uncharacterized protein n=1 Tax=Pleuronectes platessa TaxID=8262 RepID=A0A9N7UA34_PLEPL|nr:unnamed protein product [Pleuronectes platessa]